MDADVKEKRRERVSSQREKRWSMNSQRLEEIVAELMRPIGDLRRSFDTDLSALLEEYLTEAGLHALDAEDEDADGAGAAAPPNFAELALLLQQSASIYGRKVDFLYQHVLSVSDSLHNSTMELANTSHEEGPATPSTARRKRKASVSGDFVHIGLEPAASARREPGATRPPPTLPRVYTELEPRVLADTDTPLRDYEAEPIGLLADFHVAWRLQDGLLVEELEASSGSTAAVRPLPLVELQEALAARAEEAPPPLVLREDSPGPEELAAAACSTPLPPAAPDEPPPPAAPDTIDTAEPMPPPLAPLRRERKRKSEYNFDDIDLIGKAKIFFGELVELGVEAIEFPFKKRVVRQRTDCVLRLRRMLRAPDAAARALLGFDLHIDLNGFEGWSRSAGAAAAAAVAAAVASARARRSVHDSDDDGFFEQSSLDSDVSRLADSPLYTNTSGSNPDSAEAREAAEWAAWRSAVARRAAAAAARPALCVRGVAAAVLARVPPPPAAPLPVRALLAAAAHHPTDVSRILLASLFLANSGNVEIVQGAPLSVDSFSLRLVSADARLYCSAADIHNTTLAPATDT